MESKRLQDRKIRVCVIGAGPSGMCALYQLGKMTSRPEVVCYEKQSTWGGMWNLTWRTGSDEFGEPCHGSMYKHLWMNSAKEAYEYPDYTYEEHYGEAIPSFPPRDIQRNYFIGRAESCKDKVDLKSLIQFNHVVRYARYDKARDEFIVTVTNLLTETSRDEIFTHVFVTTGIFNVPNLPDVPGIENFPGRVLHAHDFRDAEQYKGHRILVIGSSYSAEDIALQCMKFGACRAVCAWRSKPMSFNWPDGIEEHPSVQNIDGSSVTFKDGYSAVFDVVILATGYKYHFPFMEDCLRLVSPNNFYPDNLYKGVLMTKGGNNKCFYIGAIDQYYTFTMFDVQAKWACKYIEGSLDGEPKSAEEMRKDMNVWIKRLSTLNNCHDDIDFQTAYVADLCHVTGNDVSILEAVSILKKVEDDRAANPVTYRDRSFTCIFTGTNAPEPKIPWYQNFDDSNETFLAV